MTARLGKRKPRSSHIPRQENLGNYIIVTDTSETEQNYMYGLRDSIPEELRRHIVIKVVKTKTVDLVNDALYQASINPQYAEIWILFDRDQVPNFDAIVSEAEAKGIHVGWSNPCIEIWFSAYFKQMNHYSDSVHCCKGFEKLFQDRVNQPYKKSDNKIYLKLCQYGNESEAIRLAEKKKKKKKRNGHLCPSKMNPGTTVHELVREIRSKIK